MIEVDSRNWSLDLLESLIKQLETCSFVALDCEFLRVTSHNKLPYFASMSDDYCVKKDLVKSSVLCQLGLSIATERKSPKESELDLQVSNYSFMTMRDKTSRNVTSVENGCLNFLANNHFDFNRLFKFGIDPRLLDSEDFERNFNDENRIFTEKRTRLSKPVSQFKADSVEQLSASYSRAMSARLAEKKGIEFYFSAELVALEFQLVACAEEYFANSNAKSISLFVVNNEFTRKKLDKKLGKKKTTSLEKYAAILKTIKSRPRQVKSFFQSPINYTRQHFRQNFFVDVSQNSITVTRKPKKDSPIEPEVSAAKDPGPGPAKESLVPYSKLKPEKWLAVLLYYVFLFRKPIVMHHGIFDLMYVYDNFFERLPDDLLHFVRRLDQFWPEIYCTKFFVSNMHNLRLENGKKVKMKRNKSKTGLARLYQRFVLNNKANLDRVVLDTPRLSQQAPKKEFFTPIDKFADPETNALSHSAGYDSMITAVLFFFLKEYVCVKLKDEFYEFKKNQAIHNGIIVSLSIEEWVTQLLRLNFRNCLFSPRSYNFTFKVPTSEHEEINMLHNQDFLGKSLLLDLSGPDGFESVVDVLQKFGNFSIKRESERILFVCFDKDIRAEDFQKLTNTFMTKKVNVVRYRNRQKVLN